MGIPWYTPFSDTCICFIIDNIIQVGNIQMERVKLALCQVVRKESRISCYNSQTFEANNLSTFVYIRIVHIRIVHDGPNICKCDPTISNPDSSNFGLSSPHIKFT